MRDFWAPPTCADPVAHIWLAAALCWGPGTERDTSGLLEGTACDVAGLLWTHCGKPQGLQSPSLDLGTRKHCLGTALLSVNQLVSEWSF